MIKLTLVFSLLLTLSCSRYVDYLEKKEGAKIDFNRPKDKNNFCPQIKEDNIVHDSSFTIEELKTAFEKLSPQKINIIEKGIYLSLYQMLVRPDATDWSSRTQIHIRYNGKSLHKEYGSFSKLPLLEALINLGNQGFINRSLNTYILQLEKVLPKKLTMQEKFHLFLKKNQKTFIDNPTISQVFFKLGKPLQKGESFVRPRLTVPKMEKTTFRDKKEFPLTDNFSCSFDAQLYQKGIFLISKKPFRENAFGIIAPDGDYFFIVTKKELSNGPTYTQQTFWGAPPSSISPFCRHTKKDTDLILLGFNSRDPGQLLYHLFNYQIMEANEEKDIVHFLNFPRHQFLTNPSRLLYESSKGSEEQLRYFLSLDFPVYHVDKLGVIYALWTKNNQTTFIDDSRFRTFQSCFN